VSEDSPTTPLVKQVIFNAGVTFDGDLNIGPRALQALDQLPGDLPDFTGRHAEMEDLKRRIGGGARLICITGKPGSGKSALALHVAHLLAADYPGARLYAELGGASDSPADHSKVLRDFVVGFGVPAEQIPQDPDALVATFRSLMSQQKAIVLLDDARDEAQMRPLLPSGRGCLTIVTSRHVLTGLEGSQLVQLGELDFETSHQLLESIAGRPLQDNREALSRILSACGGLPLAIRIAGSQLRAPRAYSLEQMAARLASAGRLLQLNAGDRNISSTFDSSYASLPEEQARAFRLLALATEPTVRLRPAQALLGLSEEQAEEVLWALAEANLLDHRGGHFSYHDLLREYARSKRERLDEEGSAEALGRLCAHYVQLASQWDETANALPDPLHLEELDASRPGIPPAARFLADQGDWASVVLLVKALFPYYRRGPYYADAELLLRLALSAPEHAMEPSDRAGCLNNMALYQMENPSADPDAPEKYLRAAHALVPADDEKWRTRIATNLGTILLHREDYRGAAEIYSKELQICDEANVAGRARLLGNLAVCHSHLDQLDAAEAEGLEAIDLYGQLGNRYGEALTWGNLDHVYLQRDQPAKAVEANLRALQLFRALGDQRGEASSLMNHGMSLLADGKPEQAVEAYGAAEALAEHLGLDDLAAEAREAREAISAQP
jgi:energy-coupling factor transporter ATP-binding protein EcfA2